MLRLYPKRRELSREARAGEKALARLSERQLTLETQLEELNGVILYNEFPLRLIEEDGGNVEVASAIEDTSRNAYVSRDSAEGESPERWRATAYRSEGSGEGRPLVEGVGRRVAVKAAKDFVASGRIAKPQATTAKRAR